MMNNNTKIFFIIWVIGIGATMLLMFAIQPAHAIQSADSICHVIEKNTASNGCYLLVKDMRIYNLDIDYFF